MARPLVTPFDYAPDICSVARIDYIVDNPDGTKYYFGKHGELRTIVDRYGNKITFDYTEQDFYGVNDSPVLSSITDTVGECVKGTCRFVTFGVKNVSLRHVPPVTRHVPPVTNL